MSVNFPKLLLCSIATLFCGVFGAGCDGEPTPSADAPLRPLIYTEHPERTPEGVAVREERIMRELVEGSEGGAWGELQVGDDESVPLGSADQLGAALFDALVDRDARKWDSVFVPARDYAALVHVKLKAAEEFVDDAQGASSGVWNLFETPPASEAIEGGFRAVYELESLQLGEPRAVDGKLVEGDDETVAQYWGNELLLKWRGTDQTFSIRIPKILRVRRAGTTTLRVASPISADRRMQVMHAAGMHLKPRLLESEEYPMPYEVGNFWRYRRYRGDKANEEDPLAAGLRVQTDSDAGVPISEATEVIDEVVSVDRFGSWRLVSMRRSYNDTNLTKSDSWLLVLPRRVYLCIRACRNNIEDASWLLTYVDQQTPIFVFPLQSDAAWGVGGRKNNPAFRTKPSGLVETPAGLFDGGIRIEGRGPLGTFDSRLAAEQSRDVVWGEGIVRRQIRDGKEPLTEELVEHRVR